MCMFFLCTYLSTYKLESQKNKPRFSINPRFWVDLKNFNWVLSYKCSIMFNPKFKTKVLLNMGLESFMIRAI